MREGQWNLSYAANSVYPAVNITFGTMDTGMYLIEPYEISYGDQRNGDTDLPLEDGARFGQDWQSQGAVTFEIGVDAVDDAPDRIGRHGAVIDRVDVLRQAWRADALRRRFGTVAALRTIQGGHARRVYGRPRKFAPAASQLTRLGYTPVVAEFAMADDLAYDDVEQDTTVHLVPPPTRGLTGPLSGPISMVQSATTNRPGTITVGGKVPAWPVIWFHGPIRNPRCELVNWWTIGLNMTLTEGQYVRIDPRPWVRTVLRDGGANVAGSLIRNSLKLKDLRLPVGKQTLVLRGVDSTGIASMRVAWRDAYPSL